VGSGGREEEKFSMGREEACSEEEEENGHEKRGNSG